jgi:hypothetical protein
MEIGAYQLQIFTSLVLILGASLVALICDYLKGHNEQLRELTLELKVRREEEQKLMALLTARHAAVEAPATGAQAGTIASETHSQKVLSPEALDTLPEPERALSRATAPAARSAPSEARTMVILPEPTRVTSANAGSAAEILHEMVAAASVSSSATAASSAVLQPATIPKAKKDWNSLLASQGGHLVPAVKPPATPEQPGLLDAVMAATSGLAASPNHAPPVGLQPTGFQNGSAWGRLIESRRLVSGLVVSIGVNSANEKDDGVGSRAGAIRSAIESLLEPGESAGPSGRDEFVLLLPAERGASAQRRLTRIAQNLWDFQLGSLSKYGVQFTWGGVEVREEPMDEAVASAAERMRYTRRSRKILAGYDRMPEQVMDRRTPEIFLSQSV